MLKHLVSGQTLLKTYRTMDTRLLANAKKDIPLYFKDFKAFWDLTNAHYTDKDLVECYYTSLIFKNWKISLNHIHTKSLNGILQEIHEDINASFFHSYFGLYRSAHMHLRSVIELSLQMIYFYQHEVEYEQWKNADFIIKHRDLTNYLIKHPRLNSPKNTILINEVTNIWKLFSKYIHAEAPVYFQTNFQSTLTKSISKKDFDIWKYNYLKTGYLLNKLFLMFFKNEIKSFPTQQIEILKKNMKKNDLIELGLDNS
jgi:hypothetical protein